jgi:hypothetical protein
VGNKLPWALQEDSISSELAISATVTMLSNRLGINLRRGGADSGTGTGTGPVPEGPGVD